MIESMFNRVNDYTAVRINLATPELIRSWSYGEVKKPETINYRTYRSEKDGLFCERIFGPERDWECACGKYKGIKHKGIICDRCGVKVTHSRVRRKRMGHISLAAPVVHIWFFKAMPSRLGTILDMKTSSLERVVYFQDYVVVDKGDTPLKDRQLLTEEQYREARDKYGDSFRAGMGAEAIKDMLRDIDLEKLSEELRAELETTRSKQRTKDLLKRLRTIEALRDSGNRPEHMVLDVIPVIPPDLRPLVLLDSGNFATSDLNDLYRRLINRNNRLKKLLDLNAPEVIIRNEKRMLQQSVDALFDNARCRRSVLGSSNRPLKSLTDMIKGKQGRFRENLLGKRVDYSARSVIVVGPDLKLHQCGMPKKIALELYQPFIIRRLKELGYADTIKSAKKMLERKDEEVWDILEEVTREHPVLLNRAPTLHRMGIQAFEPVLIDGHALRLHPLVCGGFNADFDGDQMAVHLPLSYEAQLEAITLVLSTNNIFSPQNGKPIIAPSQDMVLGIYYLTVGFPTSATTVPVCAHANEVFLGYSEGRIGIHDKIKLRLEEGALVASAPGQWEAARIVETTVGRVLFNDILPYGMPFYNYALNKGKIGGLIDDCHRLLGKATTLRLLDDIKDLGFKSATRAGLSFAKDDMRVPDEKAEILREAEKEVSDIERHLKRGEITRGERYSKIIDTWTRAREDLGRVMMDALRSDERDGRPYLNPIYAMADSGARGSVEQIRQLAGMRGLMAKPSGKIIEVPIKSNFREGLHVLEYFSSTHGARKGLADTALKTADSGYLTRKLSDVAQNVVISREDCGTLNGISKGAVYKGDKLEVSLAQAIRGRTARDTIIDVVTDEVVVREGEVITESIADRIEQMGYEKVRVRSSLTCEASEGICQLCYGMDLSRGRLVELGLAVGIIAAQSIGEPGTQLTMRTFHIGGTATKGVEESDIKAAKSGRVAFHNLKVVSRDDLGGKAIGVAINRSGELILLDDRERELDRYAVPLGAALRIKEGQKVKEKEVLFSWDPFNVPILAEVDGVVRFDDIVDGKTMREEVDQASGVRHRVIMEHKGDLHPQIIIEDKSGTPIALYPVPERAHLEVEPGGVVTAGQLLAKTPREIGGTQDIVGGLPRVTEVYEARRPKEPATLAEIDGIIELGDKRRGKRTILIKSEGGQVVEHLVPHGKHLRVHSGDRIRAGQALVDGPLVPHEIVRISGVEALQDYLLAEVQNVYRAQNVTIDDKHHEIIISQMLRKVRIEDPGDTDLLPGAVVDKFRFRRKNQRVIEAGGKPARAEPLLLGITKASLQSESFISAASFQETTKVLTQAALAGRVDHLVGLKENVILGHLIPAGTGFRTYVRTRVQKNIPLEESVAGFAELPEDLEALKELKELLGGLDDDLPAASGGDEEVSAS
ncbi:MAG: DNA-directed RNA polymerase subunit beta' [Planctomycetes bacterium]|nr:DNA-directed RNA polymerase subunit beta' [Planctomycetota bacterium]MCB9829109.1 DNA-directed RNA polymerase subunit beta' [Planctomycetota bacterium]MCB9901223.1 DNA-directed RNA polymerase subunit beta' [Planctomycetota bacterium]